MSQTLTGYENLSALTEQMREAAVRGEWEELVGLEQQCSRQVAALKPLETPAPLAEPERLRKIDLIKKILANDAEIRNHTEVWMHQLQRIMKSNRQEQRLQQVYAASF